MERSFARGTRYGYKRARWRGLWRVQIQEYLTASIQNIMVLLGHRNIEVITTLILCVRASGPIFLKRARNDKKLLIADDLFKFVYQFIHFLPNGRHKWRAGNKYWT